MVDSGKSPNGIWPSSGERLAGIEGLRALAAASIVALHVWIAGSPDHQHYLGPLATDVGSNLSAGLALFFTLSGFLLYRPFAKAILQGDRAPGTRRYLRRRAVRILPAYWVVLTLAALVLQSVRPTPDTFGGLHDPSRFVQNLLLLQNYTPRSVHTGISPTWSLVVEAIFYLLLPLLALLGARAARGRAPVPAALLPAAFLLVVGVVARTLNQIGDPGWHEVMARSFLCNADMFAFGMCAAVLSLAAGDRPGRLRPRGGVAGLAVGAVTMVLHARGVFGDSAFNTFSALACGLLLLYVALPAPGRAGALLRALESRPLVFAGVVSYSVFLWHEPVTIWLYRHGLTSGGAVGVPVNILLVLSITLALATLTYALVEAPAMGRTLRLLPRGPRAAPRSAQAAP